MNKINSIIAFVLLTSVFISCKKDSSVQEAATMTRLFIVNKVPESTQFSLKVDGEVVAPNFGSNQNTNNVKIEGKHNIILFNPETNDVLMDTIITTSKKNKNSYMFFRPNPSEKMQLMETVNTDDIAPPSEGHLKVSLANFTSHLPENIEIVFVQDNMYTGEVDTAAAFNNPGKAFSEYKEMKMFPLSPNTNNTGYRIVLIDAITKTDLAFMTDPATGEPIDWSWFIGFEASPLFPQQKIFTLYLYSVAEDPSAPTHFSTYLNIF